MPDPVWMKVDPSRLENPPALIRPEDECYFLREYTAHAGFTVSDGNQDIENFKKKRSLESTKQWFWKLQAVGKFAREVSALIGDQACTLMAIPTSKVRTDPEFDPRFDLLLQAIQRICPQVKIAEPLLRRQSVQALHHGGDRSLESVYDSMQWHGFVGTAPDQVVLIDDVLTRGTSYRACKRHLLERYPAMDVPGLFWTRCVWRSSAAKDFSEHLE